jgi:cytochrome P450
VQVSLQTNFLTLHREPIRHQYFAQRQDQDPFFDPLAKAWIVVNPIQCRDLIASPKLRPATYEEDYRSLESRLGIDFSSLTFAFSHIPLCLHGERHARQRRRASEFLATRKAALNARIPAAVAARFDAFRRQGHVEVMQDVVLPLVRDVISTIVDIDIAAGEWRNSSLVFDKSIGVSKRRAIAAEIAALRELIAARLGPDASDDDVGLRLALVILGKDALVGTLGESLHRLFAAHSSRRLSDIDYPKFPPQTGVPFIERLVVTPFALAGSEFAAGDRVRIFLQAFAYEDEPRSRANFFGAGAHACLGRAVSVDVWNAIAAFLSGVPLFAHVRSYSARTSDYVFACPERLHVELRP